MGSPPRVRGKVYRCLDVHAAGRITPACAGKSLQIVSQTRCDRDHPRVCGEKAPSSASARPFSGSPPRVRGKERVNLEHGAEVGITPACAGKREIRQGNHYRERDHPRVCGEKMNCLHMGTSSLGSPPRVRGKALFEPVQDIDRGITPACAGKSFPAALARLGAEDHPRVCGEKNMSCSPLLIHSGSPPRVRGKDVHADLVNARPGITPACAGKRRTAGGGNRAA